MLEKVSRTTKMDSHNNKVDEKMKWNDCLCSICRNLMINPVTLPCKHELCLACFKKTMDETSLACPFCRKRLSVWARRNTSSNTLVNNKRWSSIKKAFPKEVKKRLDGALDDSFTDGDGKLLIDLYFN